MKHRWIIAATALGLFATTTAYAQTSAAKPVQVDAITFIIQTLNIILILAIPVVVIALIVAVRRWSRRVDHTLADVKGTVDRIDANITQPKD